MTMMVSALAVAVAVLLVRGGRCGSVRGSTPTWKHEVVRSAMESVDDFSSLNCNNELDTAKCDPWTELYGAEQLVSDKVIIECGKCVEMDLPEPQLTLLEGIDIHGKLIFPDGYDLILRTPVLVIQGELEMYSTKAVDGTPSVRIILIAGGEDTFVPIDNNEGKCGGESCFIGKKAVVVAGGKVNVKGLPDQTPTWVKLHDVELDLDSDIPKESEINPWVPPPSNGNCNPDGIYFRMNFNEGCGDRESFAASPGSKSTCTSNSFKVFDRSSSLHGSQLDMKYFRACLEANRKYLLTVQVRLSKAGTAAGTSNACNDNGLDCMELYQEVMSSSFTRRKSIIWQERPSLGAKFGELVTIAVEIVFDADDLDAGNIYQLIKLDGLASDVDVEIESLSFFLPPAMLFPLPGKLCEGLAPPTGDAEHGGYGSPYPFYPTHPWILASIEPDTIVPGNSFFRVRGRSDRVNADAGLAWDIEKACLHEGAYLRFSADIRLPVGSSQDPFEFKPVLRVEHESGDKSTYALADCAPAEDSSWQTCEGFFIVPEELVSNTAKLLQVRLVGSSQIDYDIDNISMDIHGSDPNVLVVESSVAGKWALGAEILITSHTTNFDDHQVREITEINLLQDGDFARVLLNAPLPRPTTVRDSADFAVEVALLSRNIVLEGGADVNPLHGGHFWVFHTPIISQHIEGLEIKNFGQQGILGRYPIHFHFCGDSSGSVVLKNSVRNSNQRAIVVHGTDNLRVEENVVFNIHGHAIILEDGIETGNLFLRNLGAYTRAVNILIPDDGSNGSETDKAPATFWVTNPSNYWVENVAAGSESSGFWFELRLRGTRTHLVDFEDPRYINLGSFENNVAHSNDDRGFRSYPNGYMPDEVANIYGFRSYRNKKKGLFFHNTENVAIKNSMFADNSVAVDLDRSENITVTDTTIIGRTDLYSELEYFQSAPSLCYGDELLGMELHTFVRKSKNNGAVIDVTFDGFEESTCGRVAHLTLDNEMRLGTFDWFTTLERISFSGQPMLIDFCPASNAGIVDAYLTDIDGSVRELDDGMSRPGTIISNSAVMTSFLDMSKCLTKQEGCYAYCDVCFRTVRFDIDPSGTTGYELQVCEESGSPCVRIGGATDPTQPSTSSSNYRVYNAHLPPGTYHVAFLSGDEEVWPTFVHQTYEEKLCPNSFDEGVLELVTPSAADGDCSSLIRNGAMEIEDDLMWLTRFTGIVPKAGLGIGGSTAIKDTTRVNQRDAFVQFLDSRCFRSSRGRSYEINAWIKLVDGYDSPHKCQANNGGCPEVRIGSLDRVWPSVATLVPQVYDDDYQLLHGVFVVEKELVESNLIELFVMRNRVDYNMLVDNVSMTLKPELSQHTDAVCSENLVENGYFDSGDAKFWSQSTGLMKIVGQQGNFALQLTDGNARGFIKVGCLAHGKRYEVLIKYKILYRGQTIRCDETADSGPFQCPAATLLSYHDGSFLGGEKVAQAIEASDGQEWSELYGIFTASSDQSDKADQLVLQVDGFNKDYDYVLTSVSLKLQIKTCRSNILVNSNLNLGVTAFWIGVQSSIATVSDGFDDDSALLSYSRERPGNGPRFNSADFFDTRCLDPGNVWEIEAQIKLFKAGTNIPAACDLSSVNPSEDACPALFVEVADGSGTVVLEDLLRSYEMPAWNLNGWNLFRGQIVLPSENEWDGSISSAGVILFFRSFPIHLDLVLDNFILRQID